MLMQERQRSTKLPNSDQIHLTRFGTCCKGTPERVVKNSRRGLRGSIFVGELLLSQGEISCLQLSCSPWWLEKHEQQLASLVHLQSMVSLERIGAELPGWPRMAQVRCQKLLENASGKCGGALLGPQSASASRFHSLKSSLPHLALSSSSYRSHHRLSCAHLSLDIHPVSAVAEVMRITSFPKRHCGFRPYLRRLT